MDSVQIGFGFPTKKIPNVQKRQYNALREIGPLRVLAIWFVYPSAVSLKLVKCKHRHHDLRQVRTVSDQFVSWLQKAKRNTYLSFF